MRFNLLLRVYYLHNAALFQRPGRASAVLCALLFLGFAVGCKSHQMPASFLDPGKDLILKNITIVDTHDGHLSPGSTVYIRAGKIAGIDQGQSAAWLGSAPIVDGQGKFLVPGFVDAHAHVIDIPDATDDEALMLINGITGWRQMSGSPEALKLRRENRLITSAFAPRLLAMPGNVLLSTDVFTPQQGVAEVDRQKQQGADFIKVGVLPPQTFFAVGAEANKVGIPFEGHLQAGVDPIDAVNAGYRSMEHLGPGATILIDCSTREAEEKQAIAAHPMKKPPPIPGFIVRMFLGRLVVDPIMAETFLDHDTISRMQRIIDSFDEGKCRSVAAAIAKTGTWQVPTLIRLRTSNFFDDPEYQHGPNLKYVAPHIRTLWAGVGKDFTKKFTPQQKATIQSWWQLQLKLARILDAAGVPMMAGSDSASGTAPGFNLHQEFALLAQDGFTPLKILQMTTLNPAKFYGREATMGSVHVGADADLVLLNANPIDSAMNLDQINSVVRNGTFYSRQTLDAKLTRIAEDRKQ